MLPPGLDLGHPSGCFQSLAVPLAGLALTGEIGLVRVVPVDDVADDVMHWAHRLDRRRPRWPAGGTGPARPPPAGSDAPGCGGSPRLSPAGPPGRHRLRPPRPFPTSAH